MSEQPPTAPTPAAAAIAAELTALMTEERDTNDSLRSRAVGLAGFTGLTATFAASIFTSSFDGPLAVRIIAFSMLIGALLGLITGVALLVAVIAPKDGARLMTPMDEVRQWQDWADIPADHFHVLRAVAAVPVLERDRQTGVVLSRGLRRARIPIIIGLGLTATETSLVAFFSLGLA